MRLIDVYGRLPYAGRCLSASLRGAYLRWWRYSAETPRLVEEARSRERWGEDRWRRFHDRALAAVLRRAALRVPYYRRYWRDRPDADWQFLSNWPILDKESVRRDPRAFLADGCDPRRMFTEHTSGSTGSPLTLWWSRATAVSWYALVEARMRRWHGLSAQDRWAILGGQLIAPAEQRRPPFWVWNSALRQLYLSSYHLAPDHAAAYVEAMARHRVRYLVGYPSAMAELGRLARSQRIALPPLRVALSNAETLFPNQRRAIENAFGCPVRDTYGAAELFSGASECAHGRLHLWPEVGLLEAVADDADRPLPPGESGRLIATSLLNRDMPLIRYETGDQGTLAADDPCPCGRTLPVLQSLEGRLDDVVVTPGGRRIGRLDPVFKADLPIREAQIAQTGRTHVVLRVVPASGYGPAVAAELTERLRRRLGTEMEIRVEELECLPRGAAGKLRAVVSEIE